MKNLFSISVLAIFLLLLLPFINNGVYAQRLVRQSNSGASYIIDGLGVLWDCGYNGNGQLGIGNMNSKDTLQMVSFPAGVTGWMSLSSGAYQTQALGNDGNIYGCGYNGNGQLGNGKYNGGQSGNYDTLNAMVVKPSGVTSWTAAIVGAYHSLGVGSDGNLYSWGWNGNGQLGTGNINQANLPQLVTKPSGVSVWSVVVGGAAHTVVIGNDGNIYTWGYNSNGQLGIGSLSQQTTPQLVAKPSGVTSWTAVCSGFNFILALGNDGNLYSWGQNTNGQLGINSTVDQTTPHLVNKPFGVTGWTTLAAGGNHSLAICSDGNLYTWGANGNGQLGLGDKIDRDTAVKVTLPTGRTSWSAISAGQSHTLAICNTTNLYTCGYNGSGQLGIYNMLDTNIFIKVPVTLATPVELTSFTASSSGNSVNLNWITATETNNSGFSIERKSRNNNFTSVGFISGKGTTTEKSSYSFKDNNLSKGAYIYRLKQIDYDGRYAYSSEVNVEIAGPQVFSLEQNYPNPFNPSTSIKYSIPQDGIVNLAIYNLIGEKVLTLVNQNMKAGVYEIKFDASHYSSGIYFYRLDAGQFSSVRKMILMK